MGPWARGKAPCSDEARLCLLHPAAAAEPQVATEHSHGTAEELQLFCQFNLNSYTLLVATVLDSARDNTESHGANDLARERGQKRKGTPQRLLILFRVLIEDQRPKRETEMGAKRAGGK